MTDPWTAAFIVIVTNIHSGNAIQGKALDADGPWYFPTMEKCERHLLSVGPKMTIELRKIFPKQKFDLRLIAKCEYHEAQMNALTPPK